MPNFKFDFSEIPDSVVPEGEVEAVITKIELRTSKSSGQPYLNWEFTIAEGDYENSKLWMITSLTDKSLFRLKQVAESLGFTETFELEIDEDTNLVTYPMLDGTAVTLKVHHEEYQGRKQARVNEIVDYHTMHHLEGVETKAFEEDEDDSVGYDDADDDEFAALPEDEQEVEVAASAVSSRKKSSK